MKTITWNGMLVLATLIAGCDRPATNLTTPTAVVDPPKQASSRVDPNDLEDSLLESLWLEHDIWAPGVELCVTKPRTYCHADGTQCSDTIDYYTVMAPDRCPAEPIE